MAPDLLRAHTEASNPGLDVAHPACTYVRTCIFTRYGAGSDGIKILAISWLETGSFIGSICGGVISDVVFNGRRGPVITMFTLAVAGAVFVLASDYGNPEQLLYPSFFMLGFSAMGPHVLIGLAARELVPPSQSSTAGGLVTMVSRVGGVCAAAPLAKYQKVHGWDGVLTLIIRCAVIGGLATIPLWNKGGNNAVKEAAAAEKKAKKEKKSN